MARAVWKGAVSFGLVYIPVELHPASRSENIELNLLDRRDFSPVGYQRVNKRTGQSVEWGDIVKGYQYKKGEYVALSEEDFRQANVKASQTIEIESFAEAKDIPPEYYETPYYVVPLEGGGKAYALLREALKRTSKAAIGSFVMRGRQHVGVMVPEDRALVFITTRFAQALRSSKELDLPETKAVKVGAREVAMAERLIEEMTAPWDPEAYHDTYREDLMKRIQDKIRKKQTHVLTPPERGAKEERPSAEVIDLMSVLKQSLRAREGRGEGGRGAARPAAASSSRASGKSARARASRTRRRKQA